MVYLCANFSLSLSVLDLSPMYATDNMVKCTHRVLFIFLQEIPWEALQNKQLNHFRLLMA